MRLQTCGKADNVNNSVLTLTLDRSSKLISTRPVKFDLSLTSRGWSTKKRLCLQEVNWAKAGDVSKAGKGRLVLTLVARLRPPFFSNFSVWANSAEMDAQNASKCPVFSALKMSDYLLLIH